ncbi:hypothetical protein [Clostridium perfringens]|uniref:hypothetical protein n=1 Tax=Clostridium perfringens TaxID=1502 RepID=UPI002340E0D7|nr:hypothetical protein [Clostridium perfringens]MDC4245557.1 hypothetical protein [Clostridium perfringens]
MLKEKIKACLLDAIKVEGLKFKKEETIDKFVDYIIENYIEDDDLDCIGLYVEDFMECEFQEYHNFNKEEFEETEFFNMSEAELHYLNTFKEYAIL